MDLSWLDDISSHVDHAVERRRAAGGLPPLREPDLPYRVELGSACARGREARESASLPERQDSIADRLQSFAEHGPGEAKAAAGDDEPVLPNGVSVKGLLDAAKYLVAQQAPDRDTVTRLLY